MRFKRLEERKVKCTLSKKDIKDMKFNPGENFLEDNEIDWISELALEAVEKYGINTERCMLNTELAFVDEKVELVFTWIEPKEDTCDVNDTNDTDDAKEADVDEFLKSFFGDKEFTPAEHLQAKIWMDFNKAAKDGSTMDMLKKYLTDDFIQDLDETFGERMIKRLLETVFAAGIDVGETGSDAKAVKKEEKFMQKDEEIQDEPEFEEDKKLVIPKIFTEKKKRKRTKAENDRVPIYYFATAKNADELKAISDGITNWNDNYKSRLYEMDGKYILVLECKFKDVFDMYETFADLGNARTIRKIENAELSYITEHGRLIKAKNAVEELRYL